MYLLQASAGEGTASLVGMVLPMAVMFGILYFLMIRPQKKKEKETQAMRSRIEVGDEIVTIGGIIGTVVSLREDTLVLETGSDRSKIRITRWAIQANNTTHDDTPEE